MKKTILRKLGKMSQWMFGTLFIVCLFSNMIYASEHAEAQNIRDLYIQVHEDRNDLAQLFDAIENQTDLRFVYPASLNRDVSLAFFSPKDSISVVELLTGIAAETGLWFRQMNSTIAVNSENVWPDAGAEEMIQPNQVQDVEITGRVVDAQTGEPLPGVNVVLEGTTIGTITNMDGEFEIDVPNLEEILIFSYVGYQRLEIAIENRTEINVELFSDVQLLDDIVVVGYGTQERAHLTGSIEQITSERFENRTASNVSQMLQGSAPGLTLTAPNLGFEPGAELSIQIRGTGSINESPQAHVIIDGVTGDLNTLNPRDIESITVLKDAAASAIIGSSAPFGVIMVTTKQGNSGRTVVNYNGNFSFAQPIRMPNMPDSYTFARAMNEAGVNAGGRTFTDETVDRIIAYQNDPTIAEVIANPNNPNNWLNRVGHNANRDWFDVIYGDAWRMQHNLSVSGGTESIRYYLSGGLTDDDGIVNFGNSFFKRNNFTGRIDADVYDWLDLRFTSRFMDSNRNRPFRQGDEDHGVFFHQVGRTWPNTAFYTPMGDYHFQSLIPWLKDSGEQRQNIREYNQTIAANIQLSEGLTIDTDFSYRTRTRSDIETSLISYTSGPNGDLQVVSQTSPSSLIQSENIEKYYTGNIYSTYQFNIRENHNFKILLGYQFELNNNQFIWGRQYDLASQSTISFSTATGRIILDDRKSHWATEGVFSRFNYNYDDRYLFEANARYDGTSRFAEGNRYGLFPSVSVGWNIHREDLWEALRENITELKLRASWGQLGNHNVPPYQDLALIGIQNNLNWLLGGSRPVYTTAPNLISSGLTWETAESFNIGLDIGIFNNRLMASFDLYERTTKNMLGPAEALPSTLGATQPRANNATLRTRGWELGISWRDMVNRDLNYSARLVLSDYEDVVTEFHNPTNSLTTFYEGMVLGEIWGYETIGLFQSQEDIDNHADQSFLHGVWNTGDVQYRDLNGDGVIDRGDNTVDNPGDRRVIGNSTPRYQFGVDLNVQFKNLHFSTFWQGTVNRDAPIGSPDDNWFYGFRSQSQASLFTHHMDYYSDREETPYVGLGINTDAYYPRPYHNAPHNQKNQQVQTRYLQSSAYLRLKHAQIRFDLPANVSQLVGISNMSIYVTGENLLTFTSLQKGFDPDSAEMGSWGSGKSHFLQRTFAFGFDISF